MGEGVALSIWSVDIWHWLALCQHELLLFAGVFFLLGALDDIVVDLIFLALKANGRVATVWHDRAALSARPLPGPAAVFLPAWSEAEVIGDTIARLLGEWRQADLRLYVGCYRNDPATIAAALAAAGQHGDPRLRLVVNPCDGPTTKADCLNRLYRAMCEDEARSGRNFAFVVFHDAEDVVDGAALGLLGQTIAAGADFVQLPVEPLVQRDRSWFGNQLGSHYCEEFAEAHGKTMVVRDALGAAIPGAGVGSAVARPMLARLAAEHRDGLPFSTDSLTEDYELGLAVHELGGTCRFVRARGTDGRLIATRAYFPARLDHVVTQKTRWVHGIALQGWDRIGWGETWAERWMRARDRRGPFAGLVLAVGYVLIVLTALGGVAVIAGLIAPYPVTPMLRVLLLLNLAAFTWRVAWRLLFTVRVYGWAEGLRAVLRIPVANLVAIMAGRRAVLAYVASLRGGALTWDKTPHVRQSSPAARVAVNEPTLLVPALR